MRTSLIAALVVLCLSATAGAWSNKEHIQLTRLAAAGLIADPATPPAMKAWLERNIAGPVGDAAFEKDYFLRARIGIHPRGADGLSFWAVSPDMAVYTDPQGGKVAPYGVHERLLHYVDLEFFIPDETKREYRHDLSGKPQLKDVPRDMSDKRYQRAGVLPFRVEESYKKLVDAIRAGRLQDEPGKYPRDEHAAKWAGYLAHYVQDNTQPQHATIDYKSAAYFADKRSAPNVHSEMEYKMADDDMNDHMSLREEFWALFTAALEKAQDPIASGDLFEQTVEVARASYDALPLIGEAAMHATGQGGTPDKPQGPAGKFDTEKFFRFKGKFRGEEMTVAEMKARQQAWAVKRTQRLWRQAWDEATAK